MRHTQVNQFLETREESTRNSYKSNLKRYLELRRISVDDLIKNGESELKHFEHFIGDDSIPMSTASRKTIVSAVKKFLLFCGHDIKTHSRGGTTWYYDDDPAMKDFLTLSGDTKATKRNVNRHLAKYCDYRNMTPTEIIEEGKILTKIELRVHIKQFSDALTIKSKAIYVSTVVRFYRCMGDIHIDLPTSVKRRNRKSLMLDSNRINKDIVKQLLEEADIRDGMMILALFESGMSPVDLVKLNYGNLKAFLNLEDPNNIESVAVIPLVRTKTGYDFLGCFGIQSLKYISKWLVYRRKELIKWHKKIDDDTPIFTYKISPFKRMTPIAVSRLVERVSSKAGMDKHLTSADFRNAFNTRAKQLLKHYDKELFMGHSGGLERHYDNSSLDYFVKEYSKVWRVLFDLTYDDEHMRELEDETTENREEIIKLRKSNSLLSELVLKLVKATHEGKPFILDSDDIQALERAIK